MRSKKILKIIFVILSVLLLVTIIYNFIKLGYYVDESGTSPDIILGSDGNLVNWLSLLLSFILCGVSIVNLLISDGSADYHE